MSNAYVPPSFQTRIDLDLSRNEGSPILEGLDLSGVDVVGLANRYPDTEALREAIGRRHRVPPEMVLVTAGADDALFRCFLAFPEGPVVATTPSFEMIRRYAAQVGTPLIEVPWWDRAFPIEEFQTEATTRPGTAVVVSPNNPTGNVITRSDLRAISDAYPVVVLDSAYTEFADEDLTPLAIDLGNVVVLRTLSKAFGLAGLRVGYALGPPRLIERLSSFGSPYALSGLSAALAGLVLETGEESVGGALSSVAENRKRLASLLEELGCEALPSQANFVLATDVDPGWVVPAMASLGVGLRGFPDHSELARCVRITVPAAEDGYTRLERTLRIVLAPQALLFDLDGVLADVSGSFRAAIVATAASFGVEVSPDDIARVKARGDASDDWELTRRLCAANGVEVGLGEVRERFETLYQGIDGVNGLKERERLLVDPSVLASWADRLPLAIVTARPRKDALEFCDRFGIGDFFETVVTREDAPSKPDPAPVLLALERLGVKRAWMVGDTVDDLVAARAAGVVPIAVVTPGEDGGHLSQAARVLSTVSEIEEVLRDPIG